MKRRQTTHGPRGREQANDVEWIGAVTSMPAYITGEGEPYRPEMLVWMGADGAVLGVTVEKPDELLPSIGESLQTAIDQPIHGRPHAPTRVRVASPELAAALRASHPKLDIVCAPTPEIDELLTLMRETIGEGTDEEEQSYLSLDSTPEAVASFFEAAADLFRAKPWKVVPDDESLLSVSIEQLGVHEAAISVIGQMGQSFGLILFASLDDFEAYLEAADLIELGATPRVPPHFSLNFERGADLDPVLRKEIAAHHWKVAGPNAHPWLAVIDEDLMTRPPSVRELTMAEAIARALTKLLAEKTKLRATWRGGEPISRKISVHTHGGDIEVSLRAPYRREPAELANDDILAALASLTDLDAREPLEDELLRRFAASSEAQRLSDLHACEFVMDFAANYLGVTVATLGPAELREILFAIVPRKVSVDPGDARWIVEELRAFYRYLKREHKLAQADSCLKVLDGDAIETLEAALGDRSNFGIAKSLFMAARDAGVDLDSREDAEAWLQSIQGKPLPPGIRLPSALPLPSAPKAPPKKVKRKSAHKRKK